MITEIKKFIGRLLSQDATPANAGSFLDIAGGGDFVTANLLAQMCSTGNFVAVTPSDTVALTSGCRALYVGTGGTVKVKNDAGAAVEFVNVADGTVLPVATRFVLSTGTTASDIVAL